MRPFDFAVLTICCFAWAANFVVSAWTVGHNPVPPFMLATFRAIFVLIFMGWILFRPLPHHFGRLLLVCLCVGPLHLGFLYTGLQTSSATAGSIISQILIPIATILSVIFLREKIGWIRGLGIIGAFFGTVIMVYEPGAIALDWGLVAIVMAYVSMAIGSILMKTVGAVDWRQYVAWTAIMMFFIMLVCTIVFEDNHAEVWETSKWPLLIAAGYAGLFVSILAHGQYFQLIKKYDVSQVVPLTLMVPFFATMMGIVILKETLTLAMVVGAAFIMPCVYIIAKRQNITQTIEG